MSKNRKIAETPAAVVDAPVTATPTAEVAKPAKAAPVEQNGVRQPRAGGLCRQVWDYCSEVHASTGTPPTVAQVKLEATARGWNANNASIEYYQWRKFSGIRGRVAAPVTAPVAEATAAE